MPKTDEEIAAEEAAAKAAEDAGSTDEKVAAAVAEAEKWKALSRKNEAQAKENAEKAKKYDELEEQSKTELEKAVARAEAAEKVIAEREASEAAKQLAADVAKEKSAGGRQIPASALRGTTREELEAHAEELLALIPTPAGAADADGQGKKGRIGDGEMSAEDIVAAATTR